MPSKHVPGPTWRKVELETVKAVVQTQTSIKDTEVLNLLIIKGLENITEEDYAKFAAKKRKKNK